MLGDQSLDPQTAGTLAAATGGVEHHHLAVEGAEPDRAVTYQRWASDRDV
jgi:hypothetical protein